MFLESKQSLPLRTGCVRLGFLLGLADEETTGRSLPGGSPLDLAADQLFR